MEHMAAHHVMWCPRSTWLDAFSASGGATRHGGSWGCIQPLWKGSDAMSPEARACTGPFVKGVDVLIGKRVIAAIM